MAEAYGNVADRWRAKVVAGVVSTTDTTATVRCSVYWCSIGWGFQVYGSVASAHVGEHSTGDVEFCAYSETGASVETLVTTAEHTYERGGADYAVACGGSVTLQGGYHDGTSSAALGVTVPARVLARPGAPTLTAPSSVGPGQPLSLSWAKSATQGNAGFLRFELWEDGAKVYSGTGTSATRTAPSGSAKKVSYELREVHSWFGEELYSSKTADVSVVQLSMPGAPRLTASRTQVQIGDRVTFSFARADAQGNAEFTRFELWENGARVYSGTGTSATRTPSDAQGASISYELREVHTFYGTEVHTSVSLRVGVTRQSAPTAPDLVSPASGATVTHPSGTVEVGWRHNATDGTAQTGAEVACGPSQSGPWTVLALTGASVRAAVPVGSDGDVYWRVRTRGAFDGGAQPASAWSPWSSVGYFKARTPPALAIAMPGVLTDLPLVVSWSFSDAMGSQAAATVRVAAGGKEIASKSVGAASSTSFGASELAPPDGGTVTVVLEALSTTGLSSTASASVPVRFLAPPEPTLALMVDAERMAVVALFGPGEGEGAATSALELVRGGKVVATSGPSESRAEDPTPPLDGAVEYVVRARAASGACRERSERAAVPSGGRAALNWGDGLGECAVAAYNVESDESRGVESDTFEAAAWEYPVEVYGTHRTHTGSLSADVLRRDSPSARLSRWREAQAWAGGYALRMPMGRTFWVSADIEVSERPGESAGVSVDWEERSYDGVL